MADTTAEENVQGVCMCFALLLIGGLAVFATFRFVLVDRGPPVPDKASSSDVAAHQQATKGAHPTDLPVLPEVLGLLELGMSKHEILGLSAKLDARGSRLPFGVAFDPRSHACTFTGYPKDFPADVILDDSEIPSISGNLEFQDGKLLSVWLISPSLGREVEESRVRDLAQELKATRANPEHEELELAYLEARLGPGIPAGRVLRGGPDPADHTMIRWCYFVAEGATAGWGVLDANVTPEGKLTLVTTYEPGVHGLLYSR